MESLEMIYLKTDIVKHLIEIEDLCKERNIPMNKVTLILRDPHKENMIVLLTTEKTSDDVRAAVETALRQAVIA